MLFQPQGYYSWHYGEDLFNTGDDNHEWALIDGIFSIDGKEVYHFDSEGVLRISMPQSDLEYLISGIDKIPKSGWEISMPLPPFMKARIVEFQNVKRIDCLTDLDDDKCILGYKPLFEYEKMDETINDLVDCFMKERRIVNYN